MIVIDGSLKSGSGTIVRYSAVLAGLLTESLHLTNIRAKRKKPGLRPQHFKALSACAQLTGGEIKGGSVGASEIIFDSGKELKSGTYSWDIGTAGSTTMLAQTILPLTCFTAGICNIKLIGGLFQDFAPAAHHLQYIVLPLLQRMGINITLKIVRPSYVPTGNGIIELSTQPVKDKIQPLILKDQGKITAIKGIALASHLSQRKVAERMADSCNQVLAKKGYHAEISCIDDTSAIQKGASLTVYAMTNTGCIIGVDDAGRPGRSSEFIGKRVAEMLLADIATGATVDRFTADQLIIYAALAKGTTQYIIPRTTEHIETNLWLIEKILGVKSSLKNNYLTIHGIGFSR